MMPILQGSPGWASSLDWSLFSEASFGSWSARHGRQKSDSQLSRHLSMKGKSMKKPTSKRPRKSRASNQGEEFSFGLGKPSPNNDGHANKGLFFAVLFCASDP